MKKLMSAFVMCALVALTGCKKSQKEEERPARDRLHEHVKPVPVKEKKQHVKETKEEALRGHKTREHVCSKCGMKCGTKKELDAHLEDVHGKKKHDYKAHEKNAKPKTEKKSSY